MASVTRPARDLKVNRRVTLGPGEKRSVPLEVPCRSLSLVNAHLERAVESGEFDFLVDLSSRIAALNPVPLTVRG